MKNKMLLFLLSLLMFFISVFMNYKNATYLNANKQVHYYKNSVLVDSKKMEIFFDNKNYYDKGYFGVIEIEKMNLKQGITLKSFYDDVEEDIVIYSESAMFDVGNTYIAAHSGNCYYCYFDNLDVLAINDTINISYRNKLLSYSVVDIYTVSVDDYKITIRNDDNILILMTCLKTDDSKRLIIKASKI